MLAWQLLREMTVHILAEEAVLYPVVAEQVTVAGSSSSITSIPSSARLQANLWACMHMGAPLCAGLPRCCCVATTLLLCVHSSKTKITGRGAHA